MKPRSWVLGPAVACAGLLLAGIAGGAPAGPKKPGFRVPECVVVDEATGYLYVSNINGKEETWWSDDGDGFVSRLKPDGTVDQLRWRISTRQVPLNGPKGMCILGRTLYVADNTRVVAYSLTGTQSRVIPVPGARRLNDMATDGRYAYVSDTQTGTIYRLDLGSRHAHRTIQGPPSVNGITFGGGKMYAVSWDRHDVYEVDPTGQRPPRAFGLARWFKNLDGIEVLPDGSFLVSDFTGNQVCMISSGRQRVEKVASVVSPADIGLDRKRMRVFVPLFMRDTVKIYTLGQRRR